MKPIFDSVTGTVTGVITGLGTVADSLLTSDNERDIEANKALATILKAHQAELASAQLQIQANMAESGHPSLFVAGWRPAIGWLGAGALGYAYIGQPVLTWLAYLCGWRTVPPMIALDGLYPVILGMLGLGAARTWEKANGVARSRWRNPDKRRV